MSNTKENKIEISKDIENLTKEELIEYIRLSYFVLGNSVFTAASKTKYTIVFENLTTKDRLKIIWRVIKFFLLNK